MITDIAGTREELISKRLDAETLERLHNETASALHKGKQVRDLVWLVSRPVSEPASVRVEDFEMLFVDIGKHAPRYADAHVVVEKLGELPRSRPGAMLVVYVGPEGIFAEHG